MPIPTDEFARRVLLRALVRNTQVFQILDNDPDDTDEDPDLVQGPPNILDLKLADVGLTNQSQVELLRADLKTRLPLIDGELTMGKISPGTPLGLLRDFIRAALDMKL